MHVGHFSYVCTGISTALIRPGDTTIRITSDKSVKRSILDGKYYERVHIPAKAIAEFFDRYFHIPLPIVTKHELGLSFPPGTFP